VPKSASPLQFVNVNGMLFFVAGVEWSPLRGGELWRSDGTTAGTFRVRKGLPSNLVNVNGTLLFTSYDEAQGDELWRSDGTEVGTVLVKRHQSRPKGRVDVNGTLFFAIDGGAGGLWKSDGRLARYRSKASFRSHMWMLPILRLN
jgi:ELWxxDGT repeat protein